MPKEMAGLLRHRSNNLEISGSNPIYNTHNFNTSPFAPPMLLGSFLLYLSLWQADWWISQGANQPAQIPQPLKEIQK